MCWRSGGAKASRRIRRRRREAPQVRSKIRRARRCGGVSCCLHSFARLPNPRWRAAISGSSAKTPRLADGILESPRATSGRGSAWLERLVRDQEVGGSNPLAPTNSVFFEIRLYRSNAVRRSYPLLTIEPQSRLLAGARNVKGEGAPRHHARKQT